MIGGKYKIIEKIGEGGMGIVYKAEDTKLKRNVALKFLPSELTRDKKAKARLIQEAQAAAALNHPHICTVYEVDEIDDQTFFAMEFIEGQTLRERLKSGPLGIEEAVNIAFQVAEGLGEAHKKGIIHRDIKPANIMMTKKGQAKIMDFGLAKLAWGADLTKPSMIMGTVAYMSPEQARGQKVDYRADIWSFGVVLYEMLTGKLPFKGDNEQAMIYSTLKDKPVPSPELPSIFRPIITTCLEKEPIKRFQSADNIRDKLERLGIREKSALRGTNFAIKTLVPAALAGIFLFAVVYFLFLQPAKHSTSSDDISGKKSIAVLAFADMSPQKDQEYFCDGIAEELINTLTKVSGFQVTARTSAFSFKDKNLDIPSIGKKLHVDLVVEGSVRKAGDNLRITVQLIKVSDGYHLWSKSYNRKLKDVFFIQEDISRTIMEELKIRLLAEEKTRLEKRNTNNIEAYNQYLQGRYFWSKRTEEGLKKSLEHFQKAIDIDPQYALAYVGKADAYNLLTYWGFLVPTEAYPKAKILAEQALQIDDSLAEAYASLAFIQLDYDWDWPAAEASFKKALDLNPNYALTYHWYGAYLESKDQLEQSLEMRKKALALDPLSLQINSQIGYTLIIMDRLDEAEQYLKKSLEMAPNSSYTHQSLGQLYAKRGWLDMALEEYQKARGIPWTAAFIGSTYAKTGKKEKAREMIAQLIEQSKEKYVRPSAISAIYFALGEYEKAFDWLDVGFEERDPVMPWIRFVVPDEDGLRSHPRYRAILNKMRLD